MDLHQVVNSISAFSFLTSALFMALMHLPHLPQWQRLRSCRVFMSLVFLVVGLSCLKNVVLNLPTAREVIQTSTLVSGSFQALLFCCTGVAFVAPHAVTRRRVLPVVALLVANGVHMVVSLVWFPRWYVVSLSLSLAMYLALMVIYQVKFYGHYRRLVAVTDELTDENSDASYRRIKHFYVKVTILGFSVVPVVFCPVPVYDAWMLVAAVFYVYVTLTFVNYCNRSAMVVSKVYGHMDVVPAVMAPCPAADEAREPATSGQDGDFDTLERNLEQWVARREYVKNDLVSQQLASDLGVSLTVFRAYFKERLNTDFRQWRMKLRIEYACEIMLEHPGYPYDMVAQLVGINDRSNFNKAFVKIMGITPRVYGEQHHPKG